MGSHPSPFPSPPVLGHRFVRRKISEKLSEIRQSCCVLVPTPTGDSQAMGLKMWIYGCSLRPGDLRVNVNFNQEDVKKGRGKTD